jgi:hypothetical protein
MALINHLKEGFKENQSIHREIEGAYYIVIDGAGNKYLQIDTFGSKDRKIPGKISQSIQFSPEAIKQLEELLKKLQ